MIDLKNFNSDKLLKSIDVATIETLNLLNGIDMSNAESLMNPEQLAELKKAKSDLKAIKNKDFSKIGDLKKQFKD